MAAGVRGGIVSLIVGLLIAVGLLWWKGWRALPLVVTTLALVALGWMWGSMPPRTAASCPAGTVTTPAIFESVQSIKEQAFSFNTALPTGCHIVVTVPRFPEFTIGSRVTLAGKIEPLTALPTNLAGYASYLDHRGIGGTMRYPTVTVLEERPSLHSHLIQTFSQRINDLFVEPEAAFVRAMLLAEPGSLPPHLQDQFRRTGLTHLVAISGLNISLIAAGLLFVLWLLPLPALPRNLILAALIWAYIWLINFPVSAVRAAWFWTIILVGFRLRWLLSLPTIVLLVTAVLVTYQPTLLTDVSFQLSMAAVMGIGLALFLIGADSQSRWRRLVVALLGATIGATLMTWPIIVYHFGTVSLTSTIANFFVEPVFPFMLIVSIITVIISFAGPGMALMGSWLFHAMFWWMDTVTRFLSDLPGSYLTSVTLPVWVYVAYYAALALTSALIISYQKRSWREIWQ